MTSVTVASGRVYVGLDYHDSVVQVCVMAPCGKMLVNRQCANNASEIVRVVRAYGSEVHATIEACCGSAALADELLAAGWRVSLAHAGYVQRVKQGPDKTDWSDARVLADLLRVGYLPHVWLPPASLRQLRTVVRHRQQLAQQRRTAKQRVTSLLRAHRITFSGSRWTKLWIKAVRGCAALGEHGSWVANQLLDEIEHVQKQIDNAESRLSETLKGDAFVEKLMSMKGIGLVTAATLRAELGEMSRFRSGKQLSRYCGLSPRNASSGKKQADAGLIKAGNSQLRAVLIEASHRLQRRDPRWASLGAQMKRRGKPGSVVAAAIANRWVRWLYHQLKDTQAA
jgi:transposase